LIREGERAKPIREGDRDERERHEREMRESDGREMREKVCR
jgi:hypothetical protein